MRSKPIKNFCQICRRQCRDENGYHCHLNSGHHQKQLRQLTLNPQEHIQKYSNQLENRIVQILKSKYPGENKNIQDVYQQYMEDKYYIQFHFTMWKDLAEFVQHLKTIKNIKVVGKLPNCKVTYVVSKVSDFMKKKKQNEIYKLKQSQKQKAEKMMDERIKRIRMMQVQRYKLQQQKKHNQQDVQQQINIQNQSFKLDFDQKKYQPSSLFTGNQNFQKQNRKHQGENIIFAKQKNIQKLFFQLQNKNKPNHQNTDNNQVDDSDQFQWILPGITVKVLPHQIPQIFHNKKAAIIQIKQPYIAIIKLGHATLDIDQAHLETVIPKIGHEVKLLRGQFRNITAKLNQVNVQKGVGLVNVQGIIVEIPFNQFSKIA